MAVLCGLSLSVSWIACLLISSVICFPASKDYGSNPASSGFTGWRATSGSSYPNAGRLDRGALVSRLSHPGAGAETSLGSTASGGSFSAPYASGSLHMGYMSNAGVPNRGYNAPAGAYSNLAPSGNEAGSSVSGYGGSGFGNAGYGSAGSGLYDSNAESTGDVEQSPESVFSDVSDLEPIYAYRSRSSYQHGGSQFSQTRYTPGEAPYPSMPVVQRSPEQPAYTPPKGGY